jgi:cell division protein FtsW
VKAAPEKTSTAPGKTPGKTTEKTAVPARAVKEAITPPAPTPVAPPSYDLVLLTVVLALVGFGLVMVYSASAVYATQKFGSATYFLKRDLAWTVLGLTAMLVAARTDFATYRRWSYALLIASFGLLVAVLAVGARINGARRWFHFAGVSFQPAELAKLALVIYLAYSLAKKAEKVKSFTVGFVPHMIVCAIMMKLLLKQPNLGSAFIFGTTTVLLLFVAGARISYIVVALLAAAPIIYQSIVGTPFRLHRVLAFLDPWHYRYDVGYQITESLISIGSGGVTGLGLGDGRQKLLYLPEAYTDYIMAIVGEELGLVGVLGVALLFAVLVWRGARAALRARDPFGCYLGFGITAMFGLQALVNLAVVLNAIPTMGLPLPFVSFGGSTLVVDLFAMGILLNISLGAPEAAGVRARGPWLPRFPSWTKKGNRRLPGGGRRVTVETRVAPANASEA